MRFFFFSLGLLFLTACAGFEQIPQVLDEPVEIPDVIVQEDVELFVDPCADFISPSLQSIICDPPIGEDLELLFVESENTAYTRYAISYRTDDLSLSGVMLLPKGDGPFPLVLTNHGYIDTSVYTRGRGLKREQDALARAGFAVMHPDYRNHAQSDTDPNNALQFRLGYVRDVIGAIKAVQSSDLVELAQVDAERVGMLGHSMGGGISTQLAVVEPGLIDALVLYAPVSSKASENLQRYYLSNDRRSETVESLFEKFGSPEDAPAFWEGLSSFPILENIGVPVQIFIGTADQSVEVQWSYDLYEELLRLDKKVQLIEYPAAPHEFIKNFPDFKESFVEFLQDSL